MENQNLVPEKKTSGIAIASFVCGLVSFFCCNPLYLVSMAAVILGIVGLVGKKNPLWMSITGLCVGAVSLIICLGVDIISLPLTFGVGFFF